MGPSVHETSQRLRVSNAIPSTNFSVEEGPWRGRPERGSRQSEFVEIGLARPEPDCVGRELISRWGWVTDWIPNPVWTPTDTGTWGLGVGRPRGR